MNGGAERVWYACYGSNLRLARFMCYIRGGRPPGSQRDHFGCRDRTPPTASRAFAFPGRLVFAREARSWGGGGVAFVDPHLREAIVRARLHLVTLAQFVDIALQENDDNPHAPRLRLDLDELRVKGATRLATRNSGDAGATAELWYPHVWRCGETDGMPAYSFTSAADAREVPNAPSEAYLRTIAIGLRETDASLTDDQIVAYLAACPGVAGALPTEMLSHWLAEA